MDQGRDWEPRGNNLIWVYPSLPVLCDLRDRTRPKIGKEENPLDKKSNKDKVISVVLAFKGQIIRGPPNRAINRAKGTTSQREARGNPKNKYEKRAGVFIRAPTQET